MYELIVWATDGSEGADDAFQEALHLAGWADARLLAVHVDRHLVGRAVTSTPALVEEPEIRVKIASQVERARDEGVDAELVVKSTHREPAELVAGVARDAGADVIVCGTRGLGALSSALLGSFTHRLLHIAPCPVLAVGPRSWTREAVAEEGTTGATG